MNWQSLTHLCFRELLSPDIDQLSCINQLLLSESSKDIIEFENYLDKFTIGGKIIAIVKIRCNVGFLQLSK